MKPLSCFKAYDVRGVVGTEINEDVAYRIGRAFAEHLGARKVVVGSDARLSGEALKQALANGLMDGGADVIDIGLSGAEEIYFATSHLRLDGGIEVTASHNPIDHNGFKFVGPDARPLSMDGEFAAIKRLAIGAEFKTPETRGVLSKSSILAAYVEHLLSLADLGKIRPLRIVADSGNGAAGHVIDAIESRFEKLAVPVEIVKVNHEPDGNFPTGIPNPLLPDRRSATAKAVRDNGADLGIAWDGDFDRCFFYDETGAFVSGYYVAGILSGIFLEKDPAAAIICDSKLYWNTLDIIEEANGQAIMSRTGHVFFKEQMRKHSATYGGEVSAHHYFRDFSYCDSGMIPWLLVVEHMSVTGKRMSELVADRAGKFASGDEINFVVSDAARVMAGVREAYQAHAVTIEEIDGLGIAFENWRFNLRASNTEPLLRLNVESRMNASLVNEKIAELSGLIERLSELAQGAERTAAARRSRSP
jgi:phosphomannomutase